MKNHSTLITLFLLSCAGPQSPDIIFRVSSPDLQSVVSERQKIFCWADLEELRFREVRPCDSCQVNSAGVNNFRFLAALDSGLSRIFPQWKKQLLLAGVGNIPDSDTLLQGVLRTIRSEKSFRPEVLTNRYPGLYEGDEELSSELRVAVSLLGSSYGCFLAFVPIYGELTSTPDGEKSGRMEQRWILSLWNSVDVRLLWLADLSRSEHTAGNNLDDDFVSSAIQSMLDDLNKEVKN